MTQTVDAFRTLYAANHERVRRVLARLVGPLEAEDSFRRFLRKRRKRCRPSEATRMPRRGFTGSQRMSPPIGYTAGRRTNPT